jgi:hypothetical protein
MEISSCISMTKRAAQWYGPRRVPQQDTSMDGPLDIQFGS